MNAPTDKRGSTGSKNTGAQPVAQSGESLNIPRLGAGAPPAIRQDGEGDATGQGEPQTQGQLDQSSSMGQSLPAVERELTEPKTSAPIPGSLQEFTNQMARGTAAIERPAISRYDDTPMHANVRTQEVNIPITGRLDQWEGVKRNRADLILESGEGLGMEHIDHLAFLEEFVIINISESADPTAENPVQLGINGRQIFITRGQDELVRRKYVEQLLRAKPVNIKVTVGRDSQGEIVNKTIKSTAMKYPFSMVRDDNPLGRAWMRKILSEG